MAKEVNSVIIGGITLRSSETGVKESEVYKLICELPPTPQSKLVVFGGQRAKHYPAKEVPDRPWLRFIDPEKKTVGNLGGAIGANRSAVFIVKGIISHAGAGRIREAALGAGLSERSIFLIDDTQSVKRILKALINTEKEWIAKIKTPTSVNNNTETHGLERLGRELDSALVLIRGGLRDLSGRIMVLEQTQGNRSEQFLQELVPILVKHFPELITNQVETKKDFPKVKGEAEEPVELALDPERDDLTSTQIKGMRKLCGESAKEFGKKLGVTPNSVYKWEGGAKINRPNMRKLINRWNGIHGH